ncbi:MAG TPA: amidohydrolase family protein, partial [Methylomirabilota bacterium]|nr:amidohydrolase family protein [Methylomirabilota bacterium]
LVAACAGGRATNTPAAGALALVGGRVQPAPDAPAIADGVVVIEGGTIRAVGRRGEVALPAGATTLDCTGATVSAGFWNNHVHFTQPVWNDAAHAPADKLATALRDMLTSRGFVRVVDLGSYPPNTTALRRRIESGEIVGPAILTAGGGLVPAGGSPFYIRPAKLPELSTRDDAERLVTIMVGLGADAVKLFTGSYAERTTIVVMPVPIVRAATDEAHRRGRIVLAHPSNSAGARAALEGGVDVLAHTFPSEMDGPWDRALPGLMRERGMGMVPTLKLWPYELRKVGVPAEAQQRLLAAGQAQLKAFADAGGDVLFGTDVGYMTDYDPSDEYVYMQQAGLTYLRILAALTTAPAERFGVAARTGRLAPGLDGDVTVVEGDPGRDIRALGQVRYTLRGGRVLYDKTR